MPVLDACFFIDAARKPAAMRPIAERLIGSEEDLVVPIQVAIEIAAGRGDPAAAVRNLGTGYRIVPCDESIAAVAGRLARDAFGTGRFPGWADVQIGATAVHLEMYVVTRDRRHLRESLGVRVWDYAQEPEPPA